ncbi:MAG: amidase [Paucibacter sp.]|nr:amidase [Roseateles sp.]
MPNDLSSALAALHEGRLHALDALQSSQHAAHSDACRHAYIGDSLDRMAPAAQAAAQASDAAARTGAPRPRLGGLAISIKDLFDVAGATSSAGSRLLQDRPAATSDSPAVARLRQAGAALLGRNTMSEFAFSGVGINPHHGTPANPVTQALDRHERIPGGSTSGGAVSVATGAAWAALGSDTGGSIRIPAALQGLVGFKNTARLTPTEGCIPLSTTLDTACAITRSVRDAVLLHEVLAARTVRLQARPLSACRLAVVKNHFLDGMDDAVSSAFEASLRLLRQQGAQIEEIQLPALQDLPQLQAQGGFAAAESRAWHRPLMIAHGDSAYDPRVATRIRRGEAISAADYIDLIHARRRWIAAMESQLQGFDAVLSPTVPVVAPLLQPLLLSDEAFFATNALLLRNPSVVNLLDGCALSLPCHAAGQLPVGLMVWAPALQDDQVLSLSLHIEQALRARTTGEEH